MNAAPGWYDAGTPGRVRWWDGTQWTAHEAPVPVEALSAGGAATCQPPAPRQGSSGPPPGWYPTKAGELRWWDGRIWTGSRIRGGEAGIDWSTLEQPALGWIAGSLFLFAALMFTLSGVVVRNVTPLPALWIALAVLQFAMAAQSTRVRRLPIPVGDPLVPETIRPLPGEVDGPGAGWCPVSRTANRWWTGQRWAGYLTSRFGVRPTFHARRSLRTLRIAMIVMSALAGATLTVGIVWTVGDVQAVVGRFVVVGAVLFGAIVAVTWVIAWQQTRLLLLPTAPPAAERGPQRA